MLKVLAPTAITDALFVSSSVTEADYATWAIGTTYALAARVIYNHVCYESMQATNLAHTPDTVGSTWWLALGPTNRWAMFDSQTSTSTVATGSITARIAPGICNGGAVIGVSGAASVKMEMFNGATLVYTETKTLDNTFIGNWYQYFFEPYDVYTDLLFGPFPPYPSAQIALTITGTSGGATVKCGGFLAGNTVEIGSVKYGATAGIIDYSVKSTDAFGTATLVKRAFAKRTTYEMVIDNTQLRRVHSTLAELRATPAVWVGSDDYKLSPLTVYGFYKDFSINVAYPTSSTCSLEIEGMT
jgi:hypothetical protein